MSVKKNKSKNQHYVPQFYFRLFSSDGKSINVLNIKRLETFPGASIKGQCSESYFYGKDNNLEDTLRKFEDRVSRTIHSILKTSHIPKKDTADHLDLLYYILVQRNRTKHEGELFHEGANKLWKTLLRDDPDFSPYLDRYRIRYQDQTARSLHAVTAMWLLTFDLKPKLILNRSKESFIFSDSPVVFYNQYTENCRAMSCTGAATKGLQIFFPIAPNAMLHLYDAAVYKVGSKKSDCCEIGDTAEVRKFNELQILNALENVYYRDEATSESIKDQARELGPRRRTALVTLEETPMPAEPDASLLSMEIVGLKARLRPSFVKIKKSMQRIPLAERDLVRTPDMKLVRAFFKQIEGKNCPEWDLAKEMVNGVLRQTGK